MSYREVNLLRDRSLRMLSSARRSLLTGDYDIAAFMADQAVQLYIPREYERDEVEEAMELVKSLRGEA